MNKPGPDDAISVPVANLIWLRKLIQKVAYTAVLPEDLTYLLTEAVWTISDWEDGNGGCRVAYGER